ncbi:MAG: 4Fe-4S binding protein [Lachnospiraceae bacterium]|nr:4Fe-4S binding protein [Lachnospiraceae bacterium]
MTVDRKTKTWKVDYDKCVMCAICNDKCPKHALDFKG